jgi:hypothetical protein
MKKIVALVSLMVVLTACGGGGGRPSTDDIAKSLKSSDNAFGAAISASGGTISDDVVDCIAKALHDSDVSDGALKALVENDNDYKGSDKDAKALQEAITTDVPKCITG